MRCCVRFNKMELLVSPPVGARKLRRRTCVTVFDEAQLRDVNLTFEQKRCFPKNFLKTFGQARRFFQQSNAR